MFVVFQGKLCCSSLFFCISGKALLLILFYGVILIYIYALICFAVFRDNFVDGLFNTTFYEVMWGLLYNGFIAGTLEVRIQSDGSRNDDSYISLISVWCRIDCFIAVILLWSWFDTDLKLCLVSLWCHKLSGNTSAGGSVFCKLFRKDCSWSLLLDYHIYNWDEHHFWYHCWHICRAERWQG